MQLFNLGESATLNSYEAMWKTAEGGNLTKPSLLYAKNAFIQNEMPEVKEGKNVYL